MRDSEMSDSICILANDGENCSGLSQENRTIQETDLQRCYLKDII